VKNISSSLPERLGPPVRCLAHRLDESMESLTTPPQVHSVVAAANNTQPCGSWC